ncbi:MAG: dihydrofolate reductase [Hyphomicrobium sp.]
MTPTTSMIALISEDHALSGPVHSIAWRAPWLANRSLQMTRHRPVVLGRKAFHYLNMLSADRWVFVVTRDEELLEAGGNHHLSGFGFWYMPNLDRALDAARSLAVSKRTPEVFVAGGVSVYQQALPQISRLYRTVLHEPVETAARLDAGALSGWKEVHAERRQRGADGFADQTYSVIECPA